MKSWEVTPRPLHNNIQKTGIQTTYAYLYPGTGTLHALIQSVWLVLVPVPVPGTGTWYW